MDRLRQFLDEYWTGSLQRLQELAESAEREKGTTDAELTREVVMDASPATIFPSSPTRPSTSDGWHRGRTRSPGRWRVPGAVQGKHPGVGDFVEVVPDRKVVFTFGWDEPDHPIPARSTEVEITLIPDGDKTRVRLVHRSLPDDAVGDHTQGWDHYLDRLAVVATGGVVGPTPPVTPAEHAARGCARDVCIDLT